IVMICRSSFYVRAKGSPVESHSTSADRLLPASFLVFRNREAGRRGDFYIKISSPRLPVSLFNFSLPRVVRDDELLADFRLVQVLAHRRALDRSGECVAVDLEPAHHRPLFRAGDGGDDRLELAGLLLKLDFVAYTRNVARDVESLAV